MTTFSGRDIDLPEGFPVQRTDKLSYLFSKMMSCERGTRFEAPHLEERELYGRTYFCNSSISVTKHVKLSDDFCLKTWIEDPTFALQFSTHFFAVITDQCNGKWRVIPTYYDLDRNSYSPFPCLPPRSRRATDCPHSHLVSSKNLGALLQEYALIPEHNINEIYRERIRRATEAYEARMAALDAAGR